MNAGATNDLLNHLAECLIVDRKRLSAETAAGDIEAWDSMGLVEIVFMLQREYGVSVPPENAGKLNSVPAIIEVLTAAGKLA
ncbi:MAG: acyl carrier protein [Planctomycetaceae bacterium]|nr:acyl carrier protein [Planctomycetaceae bacterium]